MSGGTVGRWLFGKLPSHGDFVARGLNRETHERLDRWLSAELANAQAAHDDIAQIWDAAPAWLFTVHGDDQADDDGNWRGGALCASVDKVGRRFPVMMSAPAPDCQSAAGVATGCLAAICQTFEEGRGADWLFTAELTPIDYDWQPQRSEWALAGESGPLLVLPGQSPDGVIALMLERTA